MNSFFSFSHFTTEELHHTQYDTRSLPLQIGSAQVQQSHILKNLKHEYIRQFCLHHTSTIIAAVSLSYNCNGADKQLNRAAGSITITLKASNIFL